MWFVTSVEGINDSKHSKKRLTPLKYLQRRSSQMHNILGVCPRVHTLMEKTCFNAHPSCTLHCQLSPSIRTGNHLQAFMAQKQLQLKHYIAGCQEEKQIMPHYCNAHCCVKVCPQLSEVLPMAEQHAVHCHAHGC